ncbi:MAG: DUF2815 family protein [Chromatiales bacterium]|nr:DUF2815 family protein [Gammaproteobacteria bacterium]
MSQMPRSENFTVGPVRLSYTDTLFEARSINGSEPKFGCTILMEETVRQQIDQQVEAIGRAAFPQEWDTPQRCKKPIRLLAEKPNYVQQAGSMPGVVCFASLSAGKYQPQVVDGDRQPIPLNVTDPTTGLKPIYGGCQAYVSISVFSYRHPQGGLGVSLGVSAVLKYADGTPLIEGGQVDVQSAFVNVPAAPPAAAMVPTQGMTSAAQPTPATFIPPVTPAPHY